MSEPDSATSKLIPYPPSARPGLTLGNMLSALRAKLALLTLGPPISGGAALALTMLIAPTFTASTTFMPPQQSQNGAASVLASLGSLAGLAGGTAARSSGDQYIALMQSNTISNRLIDHFKLMDVFESKLRTDARKELSTRVHFSLGKKDGLITVEVDDQNPQRAADIANSYVEELRRLTGLLAVTEAQQRRVFFERQLQQSRNLLVQAQQALQTSGFNPGALKAEPKAAAELYAQLKAQTAANEIRLQVMRGTLADDTPEVRRQQATLAALQAQLARTEQPADSSGGPDYIGKYREFKYQETLFELYARQFELARMDESREGALIQVVDPATPPEHKSRPKRTAIALGTALLVALLLVIWVLLRQARRNGIDRATHIMA